MYARVRVDSVVMSFPYDSCAIVTQVGELIVSALLSTT